MRYSYTVLLCSLFIKAVSAPTYSKQDSLRARQYFDSSWNYRLGSQKHQLYLDSALMLIPTHAWYWQQKSMPLYKAHKYEAGRPFLDSAVKYDPGRWLDYAAVLECIFERNYNNSLRDFYKALALNGNLSVMDHPYNFFIGLCHLQLNHFDSSEFYFKNCIEDVRKTKGDDWVHVNHLFYMGIVYYEKEEYTKAINYFNKAIVQYKRFSDAQYYKALCLSELKKTQEALACMEEAETNYNAGYGLNEDNALYEYYPYQLRKYYLSNAVKRMREAAAKK
jgi:tetratricopeptide (TPR) repeat protein